MLIVKEKLLGHLRDAAELAAMTRVVDLAQRTLSSHEVTVTDFFDPHYTVLALGIIRRVSGLSFELQGGSINPERQRIVLYPDFYDRRLLNNTVGLLEFSGGKMFSALKHRDFLGAVLGLGIRREKIGDMLLRKDSCVVVIAGGIGRLFSVASAAGRSGASAKGFVIFL